MFGKHKLTNTFVIGDVHGCYYTLLKLVEKLPENAQLIFVGDLCDKGNFSKEVISYVIEHGHQSILGNHEFLFLENINDPDSKWATETAVGGDKTVQSYQGDQALLTAHLNWIKRLPRYLIKEKYFITHGFGLPYYKRRDATQSKRPLMSNRLRDNETWGHDWEKKCYKYKIINVFGHDYGSKPTSGDNYFNIDSGCVYGEKLTAINLATKALITQKTDERDIITSEKGFDFIPSPATPFGFTLTAPENFSKASRSQSKHGDTHYINISFYKDSEDGQINKRYLFDKDKNHITWLDRHLQIKDKVESKAFEDGYKVVRTRVINFNRQYEQCNDTLYKDDKIICTRESLISEIEVIYQDHIANIKAESKKEVQRLEKINNFLTLNLIEQKEAIGDEVIYLTMMCIFYGPVREAGPLKAVPYEYFKSEYKELKAAHFDQLFIHALTVFALTQNESESYNDVDVKDYVCSEAEKLNLTKPFKRYFDINVKIDTNKILG